MNISDHSQTLHLMVADWYVAARSFSLKSRNTSCIGCNPQACCVNSDVISSLGKKWRWTMWCWKERSREEFVSRSGEDGNIPETKAGGVGVDVVTTWPEVPWTPSPRDYPNLVITSITRWTKSFGSNSCLIEGYNWVRVENLPQQRNTHITLTDMYPRGWMKTSGLNVQRDRSAAQDKDNSFVHVRREEGLCH